jgi:hypothetical protein
MPPPLETFHPTIGKAMDAPARPGTSHGVEADRLFDLFLAVLSDRNLTRW